MSDELQCPFCKERDFDEIGLKVHLLRGWCDQLDTLASSLPERQAARRVDVERDPPQKFRLTYYDIFGQRPSDDVDPAKQVLNGGLPNWTRK